MKQIRQWLREWRRDYLRSKKEQRDWELAMQEAHVSREKMFDEVERRFWANAFYECTKH